MVRPLNYITNLTRFPLGNRPNSSANPFQDVYNSYDYSLGGIPFLNATTPNDPIIRRTAPFRKQQFDASSEPGEQTLTGWWLRSQNSFHLGASLRYADPALDPTAKNRFDDAEGVDVWTEGQVTLLPDTALLKAVDVPAQPVYIVGCTSGTTDLIAYANGTVAAFVAANGTVYTFTYDTAPVTPFQAIASDGASIYLANGEGVWQAVIPASPAVVQAKKLWTYTGATVVRLGWVKGRLMAGIDKALYELAVPSSGVQPFALPTTPTFTSRVAGWNWTSITAGPDKIYCAGYAGNRGSILAVGLDNTGVLPTLVGATEVAQLPTGEWPLAIRAYLGTYLSIGTNRGVRIATIQTGGSVQYGPIQVSGSQPVWDFVGRDKFVYSTASGAFVDGSSGLLRTDLSNLLPTGRFAYSKDLKAAGNTGLMRSVALFGNSDLIAFSIDGTGIFVQSATQVVASGYLKSARIRFNTMFPKLFKALTMRGAVFGTLSASTIDKSGAEVSVVTVGPSVDLSQDFAINVPDSPQEYLAVKFTLNRDPTNLFRGPTFTGYQIKALPAGPRNRQWVIPVQCFDREKDKDGVVCGYPGFGYERLAAVEQLDSTGAVVLFQDLKNNVSTLVTIDQMEYRQTASPGHYGEVWGGVLNLVLRTVN